MSADAPIQQAYRFAFAPTPEQEVFRLEQRDAGHGVDVPWSYKSLCVAFRRLTFDPFAACNADSTGSAGPTIPALRRRDAPALAPVD